MQEILDIFQRENTGILSLNTTVAMYLIENKHLKAIKTSQRFSYSVTI